MLIMALYPIKNNNKQMKILSWHLVKVLNIPMHAISSFYFNKISARYTSEQCVILQQGFEDGYRKALIDLGIKQKDHPKGKRG
jgi:hypothetical protein